ncbi:protein GVQW3 [Trichonephila clavipes]|nr:protein GVQW3 [Trichonephila clavipes]
MLKKVDKDKTITSESVYEWFKRFREGRTKLKNASRAGRPKTTRTPKNIERVKKLVENDRRLTKRMIAEELGIDTESVRLILTEDLGKRKLCCRLVSHRLMPEQMEMRLDAYGNLSDMADGDRNFLNNIVAGDESWCLKYEANDKVWSGGVRCRLKEPRYSRKNRA